jgi:hypothetical protein
MTRFYLIVAWNKILITWFYIKNQKWNKRPINRNDAKKLNLIYYTKKKQKHFFCFNDSQYVRIL